MSTSYKVIIVIRVRVDSDLYKIIPVKLERSRFYEYVVNLESIGPDHRLG